MPRTRGPWLAVNKQFCQARDALGWGLTRLARRVKTVTRTQIGKPEEFFGQDVTSSVRVAPVLRAGRTTGGPHTDQGPRRQSSLLRAVSRREGPFPNAGEPLGWSAAICDLRRALREGGGLTRSGPPAPPAAQTTARAWERRM